jgi:hypothetical protein
MDSFHNNCYSMRIEQFFGKISDLTSHPFLELQAAGK